MENTAFNTFNQEFELQMPVIDSEPKDFQLTENELLSDEELAAINGSGVNFSGLGEAIKSAGDFFASVYNAGEDGGDTLNDYQHRNDSCR